MKQWNQNVLFCITLSVVVFWSVIYQNSDIMIGAILGSSVFQILVVNGVYQLNLPVEKKERFSCVIWLKEILNPKGKIEDEPVKYRSSSQYLIFSAVVLLYIAADYFAPRRYANRELSSMDGGILLVLFVTYLYLMRDNLLADSILKRFGREKDNSGRKGFAAENRSSISDTNVIVWKNERKESFKLVSIYIFLGIILLIVGFIGLRYIPMLAVSFGISQYVMGLTLVSWCVNLISIFLSGTFIGNLFRKLEIWYGKNNGSKENVEKEQSNDESSVEASREEMTEKVMRNVIFAVTLLLGIAVCIRSVLLHTSMIYNLIFFAVIVLLAWFAENLNSRMAGSSMVAVYIGFIIYNVL